MESSKNLIADAILPARKAAGVTILHNHLGGSVSLFKLYQMLAREGLSDVPEIHEFARKLYMKEGTGISCLESYLELIHAAETFQYGPDRMAECTRIAVSDTVYKSGTIPSKGHELLGTDLDPYFPVRRLELRVNPFKRTDDGRYDADAIINSIVTSMRQVVLGDRRNFSVGLIICFGRDLSRELNMKLAQKVQEWRKTHGEIILGVDLAGFEGAMSLSEAEDLEFIAECYDIAVGDEGGRTAHCGETEHVDFSTFISTVETLRLTRVGHPLTPVKEFWKNGDDSGLLMMVDKNIVAELCPRSNKLTNAFSTMVEFGEMLDTFDQFGVKYTLSNDSPALQRETLAMEIEVLLEKKAITPEQIEKAFVSADEATFLNS